MIRLLIGLLVIQSAAIAVPGIPAVRNFREAGGKEFPVTLYAPDPGARNPGLIVHLYGSGGSYTAYNLKDPAFDRLRTLLLAQGFWIVVPEVGPHGWMNDEAIRRVDAVIGGMERTEHVDPANVNLVGMSMGASSSLLYIMARPGRIRSAVVFFPVTDFARFSEERPKYRKPFEEAHGITPATRRTALAALSPLLHPEAFRATPIFLLWGSADTTVPPHQSRDFAAALTRAGCRVIFHEVPGEKHRNEIGRPYADEIANFLK